MTENEKPAEATGQPVADIGPQGQGRTAVRCPKPFDYFAPIAVDAASSSSALPDCAQVRPVSELVGMDGHFVPVSFVAKDWKVTPRRIRALLSTGRLAGRVQDNGYWEVRWPYLFSFGTRGPSLKRQQRSPKPPRLVVDNTERRTE